MAALASVALSQGAQTSITSFAALQKTGQKGLPICLFFIVLDRTDHVHHIL